MRPMQRIFLIVAGLVLIGAIVAAVMLGGGPPPSVPIRSIDPALLPEPESPGAQVLRTQCAQCHAVPDPKAHTAAEWPAVVRRMVAHTNARLRVQRLDGASLEAVDAYLKTHAR